MTMGGIGPREMWDRPFPVSTSPNPGLEAALDCFSLFRCGPALLLLELWLEPSRHTVAHALGYIYFRSTPAGLLGAFWGAVLENINCAIAAVSQLAGEEGYICGLVPCQVARWGNAPE